MFSVGSEFNVDFSAITTFVSHPSPGAAVAMVPPVIAVPAARHDLERHSSGQPQNPAEKVGYDGRPRGPGGVLKAPLETSFAEHDASHARQPDRTGAHGARLQRYVKRYIPQMAGVEYS